jgi:hypothetical protein
MGRKRFSAEQIIAKLREAEIMESKGLTQVEASKKRVIVKCGVWEHDQAAFL